MKEIGGYFGLDHFVRQEYYPDLIKLNLGRTALLYLMEVLDIHRLLLPYFLCDSVTERCLETNCRIDFYSIGKDLAPQVSGPLGNHEYLYLVNYYGQLTDESILSYKKEYGNIIVDHTHSFFQRPLDGIPTIYSCRKYFGLPDGAYLSASLAHAPALTQDVSKDRMGHILGRFEGDASDYYQLMLNTASTFHKEPVKAMSPLTENLLGAIDYESVRQRRNENYSYLEKELGDRNHLGFRKPDAPFTYPFYSRHAASIRKELAALKIYIPIYWSSVISQMPEESVEYDYAAHILPLPCDQRYTPLELSRMVEELNICLNKYGE